MREERIVPMPLGDLQASFENIGRNKNFDFYSLTRIPEIVASNDDTGEL